MAIAVTPPVESTAAENARKIPCIVGMSSFWTAV
jgi:hypothetical protein